MAKINIEFDTVSKEMSVMKDGVAISDICYVSAHKSYDEPGKFSVSIESETVDKEQKMTVRTVVYASEQSEFAAAIAARYGV